MLNISSGSQLCEDIVHVLYRVLKCNRMTSKVMWMFL